MGRGDLQTAIYRHDITDQGIAVSITLLSEFKWFEALGEPDRPGRLNGKPGQDGIALKP
jgi:hypothetical protein